MKCKQYENVIVFHTLKPDTCLIHTCCDSFSLSNGTLWWYLWCQQVMWSPWRARNGWLLTSAVTLHYFQTQANRACVSLLYTPYLAWDYISNSHSLDREAPRCRFSSWYSASLILECLAHKSGFNLCNKQNFFLSTMSRLARVSHPISCPVDTRDIFGVVKWQQCEADLCPLCIPGVNMWSYISTPLWHGA